jgi:hypothetical protein
MILSCKLILLATKSVGQFLFKRIVLAIEIIVSATFAACYRTFNALGEFFLILLGMLIDIK